MKKTFEYDDKLPSLPLPTLEHTLERYLDSGIENKIQKYRLWTSTFSTSCC